MATTIIDKLVTIFDFKSDTSGLKSAEKSMGSLEKKTKETSETMEFLKRSLELVGLALTVSKVMEYANEWDNVENKLKSVGLSGQELIKTTAELKKIANESGTDLENVAELYQQLSISMGEVVEKKDMLTMISNLNKLIAINGVGTSQAKNAIQDLSRGLEGQFANWMEIKRAMIEVPGILAVMRNHFKKMGTTVKDAMQGGAFTSKEFVKILVEASGNINHQFKTMRKTIPMAMHAMKNNLSEFFGVFRDNSGVTQGLVDSLKWLGKVVSDFTTALRSHANLAEAILISLGVAFAIFGSGLIASLAPVIIPILAIIAGITGLSLVIDDLITFFKGGDSEIGRLIAKFKAWGAEMMNAHPILAAIVSVIKDFITGIKNAAVAIFEFFTKLGSFVEIAGEKIVKLWAKFSSFRSKVETLFLGLAKAIAKPFEDLANIILSPIKKVSDWFKSSSVGKWVAKKMGFSDTPAATAATAKTNVKNPIASKTLTSPAFQDVMTNSSLANPLLNSNVMNKTFSPINNDNSSKGTFSDNSTSTINVTVENGGDANAVRDQVVNALSSVKQGFKNAVLNHDSNIKV